MLKKDAKYLFELNDFLKNQLVKKSVMMAVSK
jgi:hypothetical protein